LRWGVLLVLLLTAAIRLPGVDRPLLGNFSTKNLTYAMIARNWVEGRASFWRPTMDCLVGGERGLHLLELPVSAYLSGAAWSACGGSLDAWGRLTSVAFSVGAAGLMFSLVRRWHGQAAAYGASLSLALSPVAIIFGQSFMLEASLIFFTLGSFWTLDRWLTRGGRIWLVAAGVSFSLLLLTKIYMLVLALPLAAMVWQALRVQARPGDLRRWAEFASVGLLAVLPAAAWYADVWRISAPDHEISKRVFYSIRRSADVHHWPHALLMSADFYKQMLDELSGPLLTPIGFTLALFGAWNSAWRRHAAWLAAAVLLVVALPAKFHELPYYELAVLPIGCVMVGLGWRAIYERVQPSRLAMALLLGVAIAFSLRYAAKPAFTTPAEDRETLAAATALQTLANDGEPVAVLHGASTDILYYSNHPGWALSVNDRKLSERLREVRRQGARWLAVADLPTANASPYVRETVAALRLVQEGRDFRIYELAEQTAVATRRHGEHGAEVSISQ
jgi:4-amino-4-deoxy-L-arabinose transferase-like glycosyltransferase